MLESARHGVSTTAPGLTTTSRNLRMDIMAADASSTRRTALATIAAFSARVFAATPANSNAAFTPEPTLLGRRFLRYVSMHRWLQNAPYRGDAQEDAIAKRLAKYHAELVATAAEILARPVQSVGDIVDRLILATHEADPSWEITHANI